MNSVPYIMIITSKAHACGVPSTYREKTSQEMSSVRPMISQANA